MQRTRSRRNVAGLSPVLPALRLRRGRALGGVQSASPGSCGCAPAAPTAAANPLLPRAQAAPDLHLGKVRAWKELRRQPTRFTSPPGSRSLVQAETLAKQRSLGAQPVPAGHARLPAARHDNYGHGRRAVWRVRATARTLWGSKSVTVDIFILIECKGLKSSGLSAYYPSGMYICLLAWKE